MKALIGTFASVALVGAASAQVTSFSVEQADNQAAVDAGIFVDGTVTNDLKIDFGGIFSGSQILLELDSGEIVDLSPAAGPSSAAPPFGNALIVFDTFFAQGGTSLETTQGSVNPGAGPVNIDETRTDALRSTTVLSAAANPAGGNDIADQTDFLVARINLTSDANGAITYFASANNQFFTTGLNGEVAYEVTNGEIVAVPEPATAALLGLGGLAMLRRRTA